MTFMEYLLSKNRVIKTYYLRSSGKSVSFEFYKKSLSSSGKSSLNCLLRLPNYESAGIYELEDGSIKCVINGKLAAKEQVKKLISSFFNEYRAQIRKFT